jgi:hypothetical protein
MLVNSAILETAPIKSHFDDLFVAETGLDRQLEEAVQGR